MIKTKILAKHLRDETEERLREKALELKINQENGNSFLNEEDKGEILLDEDYVESWVDARIRPEEVTSYYQDGKYPDRVNIIMGVDSYVAKDTIENLDKYFD